jgi:hypothetical protein
MHFHCRNTIEFDLDNDPPEQSFAEKVSLTPAQKFYKIGDTIWLNFVTPDKTLFDTISKQRLPTNAVKFRFGTYLLAKYETPDNPAEGYCHFILPSNITANNSTTKEGTTTSFYLGCDNSSNYNASIGIVLKYKGYYVIDMFGGSPIEPCANQSNPYRNSGISFSFDVNDTNKDVYLTIPASFRNDTAGHTERWLDRKFAYALKVQ